MGHGCCSSHPLKRLNHLYWFRPHRFVRWHRCSSRMRSCGFSCHGSRRLGQTLLHRSRGRLREAVTGSELSKRCSLLSLHVAAHCRCASEGLRDCVAQIFEYSVTDRTRKLPYGVSSELNSKPQKQNKNKKYTWCHSIILYPVHSCLRFVRVQYCDVVVAALPCSAHAYRLWPQNDYDYNFPH